MQHAVFNSIKRFKIKSQHSWEQVVWCGSVPYLPLRCCNGEANQRVTPMQPTELQMHAVYIVYLIPWLSGVTYCSTPTLINTGWTRNEVKYVYTCTHSFIQPRIVQQTGSTLVSLIHRRVLFGVNTKRKAAHVVSCTIRHIRTFPLLPCIV